MVHGYTLSIKGVRRFGEQNDVGSLLTSGHEKVSGKAPAKLTNERLTDGQEQKRHEFPGGF